MQIEPLGDSALILRLPGISLPGEMATEAVLAATGQLRAAAIPGVVELAPASTTVGVFYDATLLSFAAVGRAVLDVLEAKAPRRAKRTAARAVEIPVCYEGEFAPDLAEVADHAGLSPEEVVQRHAAAAYRVGCVGFMPGFPYLTGLPPELAVPRRAVPRREVAAGSVAIGGSQTGIYPSASPGGWNVIGRTPLRLFDVARRPPALLGAGDAVRFRAITRAEFESLLR